MRQAIVQHLSRWTGAWTVLVRLLARGFTFTLWICRESFSRCWGLLSGVGHVFLTHSPTRTVLRQLVLLADLRSLSPYHTCDKMCFIVGRAATPTNINQESLASFRL